MKKNNPHFCLECEEVVEIIFNGVGPVVFDDSLGEEYQDGDYVCADCGSDRFRELTEGEYEEQDRDG